MSKLSYRYTFKTFQRWFYYIGILFYFFFLFFARERENIHLCLCVWVYRSLLYTVCFCFCLISSEISSFLFPKFVLLKCLNICRTRECFSLQGLLCFCFYFPVLLPIVLCDNFRPASLEKRWQIVFILRVFFSVCILDSVLGAILLFYHLRCISKNYEAKS